MPQTPQPDETPLPPQPEKPVAIVDLTADRSGKKPVLVLHIGSGKTGSSAIQNFLGANRKLFADKGILIPNGRMDYANGMGQQVFYLQGLVGAKDAPRVLKAKVDAAVANFGQDRLKAFVISAENLSNAHDLHKTFRLLRQDYELCVVFYIRRQEDFYLSAWQQWYAKTGKPHGPWVKRISRNFGDWAGTIDRWDTLEPEYFSVRVYDRAELYREDVVKDFCAILGLDPDDFVLDENSANESFGVHVSALYKDISAVFENAHDRTIEKLLYEYNIKSAAKGKNETIFTQEELRFIHDKHAEGNRRIKDRFFAERTGDTPFGPLDHTKLKRLPQEEINRRNLALIAEVMFKHILETRKAQSAGNDKPRPALRAQQAAGQEPPTNATVPAPVPTIPQKRPFSKIFNVFRKFLK